MFAITAISHEWQVVLPLRQ